MGEVIDNLKVPANTYIVDGPMERDGKENFSSLKGTQQLLEDLKNILKDIRSDKTVEEALNNIGGTI